AIWRHCGIGVPGSRRHLARRSLSIGSTDPDRTAFTGETPGCLLDEQDLRTVLSPGRPGFARKCGVIADIGLLRAVDPPGPAPGQTASTGAANIIATAQTVSTAAARVAMRERAISPP